MHRVTVLLSVFLTASGIVLAVLGSWGVLLFLKAKHWVRTPATILSLQLTDYSQYDRVYGTTYHRYTCFVRYTYTVNGTDYVGDRANSFWRGGDNNLCYRFVAKHGHDDITAFYNPRNPQDSLLDKGFHEFELCKILVVGFVFFVLGALLIADDLRKQAPLPVYAPSAVYAVVSGAALVWGYTQGASKTHFYAISSLIVGILFLVVAFALVIMEIAIARKQLGSDDGVNEQTPLRHNDRR